MIIITDKCICPEFEVINDTIKSPTSFASLAKKKTATITKLKKNLEVWIFGSRDKKQAFSGWVVWISFDLNHNSDAHDYFPQLHLHLKIFCYFIHNFSFISIKLLFLGILCWRMSTAGVFVMLVSLCKARVGMLVTLYRLVVNMQAITCYNTPVGWLTS